MTWLPGSMPSTPSTETGRHWYLGGAAVIVAAVALWWMIHDTTPSPSELTTEQKFQVLQQLSANTTGDTETSEKQELLMQLRSQDNDTVNENEKMQVMQLLKTN